MGAAQFGLADKVALITGGSRGIGLGLARALLGEGALVAICGRKPQGLEAAVQELGGGENLLAHPAHIAKEDQVEALFAAIKERFGRLDILINNVGMNLMTGPLSDLDYGLWSKIIESNLHGTFLVSRQAAALMREQKGGRIVTISSTAAHRAAPAMGVYGVAKAGLEMLTKVLAGELAPFGVTVNAVAPAMVKTDFSKPFWSNQAMHDQIVKGIPLGRLAEVADIVAPVLFFCSPDAGFITGQTLIVDGGSLSVSMG